MYTLISYFKLESYIYTYKIWNISWYWNSLINFNISIKILVLILLLILVLCLCHSGVATPFIYMLYTVT